MFDIQRTLNRLKHSPIVGVLLATTLLASACQQAPVTPAQAPSATPAAATAEPTPAATAASPEVDGYHHDGGYRDGGSFCDALSSPPPE